MFLFWKKIHTRDKGDFTPIFYFVANCVITLLVNINAEMHVSKYIDQSYITTTAHLELGYQKLSFSSTFFFMI